MHYIFSFHDTSETSTFLKVNKNILGMIDMPMNFHKIARFMVLLRIFPNCMTLTKDLAVKY